MAVAKRLLVKNTTPQEEQLYEFLSSTFRNIRQRDRIGLICTIPYRENKNYINIALNEKFWQQ